MARLHDDLHCLLCGKTIAIAQYKNVRENFFGDAFSGHQHVDHDCTPDEKTQKALEEARKILKRAM